MDVVAPCVPRSARIFFVHNPELGIMRAEDDHLNGRMIVPF